jgi:hypothetical protein
MTDIETRVAMLMTLMRQLQDVMHAESALLRGMKLDRLRELQAEKVALAEGYELALRRLRQTPEALAGLDESGRGQLEAAMREFQAVARANAERLRHASHVVEGIVQAIGRSLGATEAGAPGYRASSRGTPEPGRVIAVAFDRRC